ncbi:hypothetical protein GCM10027589_51490 [Actinocorallia lasiicapitis]
MALLLAVGIAPQLVKPFRPTELLYLGGLLLLVVVVFVAGELAERWPAWPRIYPWALVAGPFGFVACFVAANIAAELSGRYGIASRADLPWGLIWATTGARSDGAAFDIGWGLVTTPVIFALLVGAVRTVIVVRRDAPLPPPRDSHPSAPPE